MQPYYPLHRQMILPQRKPIFFNLYNITGTVFSSNIYTWKKTTRVEDCFGRDQTHKRVTNTVKKTVDTTKVDKTCSEERTSNGRTSPIYGRSYWKRGRIFGSVERYLLRLFLLETWTLMEAMKLYSSAFHKRLCVFVCLCVCAYMCACVLLGGCRNQVSITSFKFWVKVPCHQWYTSQS